MSKSSLSPQKERTPIELIETKKKILSYYKVIFYNDNVTTMDFVIAVLVKIFHFSPKKATTLMLEIHEKGSSVVGRYPKEIAETKVALVLRLAQENKFPLKVTYSKE